MKKARVNHVGIIVPELDSAVKFFADVFGVEPRAVESEAAKNLYIQFDNFSLQICEDPHRLAGARFGRLDHIAIEVDDLDETAARLSAHGVQMVWDVPVRVDQLRTNFTTEDGGVGVQFQLADGFGNERPAQEFRTELMETVAQRGSSTAHK